MHFDLLEPVRNVTKRLLVCTIIDKDDTHRSFVVGLCNCSEALLTSCVPHLKFYSLIINIDLLNLEIDP